MLQEKYTQYIGKILKSTVRKYVENQLFTYTVKTDIGTTIQLSVYNEKLEIGKSYKFETFIVKGYTRIKSYEVLENRFNNKDLISYLKNNVKGVGEKTAIKVVDSLEEQYPNENLYDLLVNDVESAIAKININEKIADKLIEFFSKQDSNIASTIMKLTGLDLLQANKYINKAQKNKIENIEAYLLKVPYSLYKFISDMSFKENDIIAMEKLQINPLSEERFIEGANYVIAEHMNSGHTYILKSKLKKKVIELLNISEIHFESLYKSLVESHKSNYYTLVDKVQFKHIAEVEAVTAHNLKQFTDAKINSYDVESILDNSTINYTNKQREAITTVFSNSSISIMSGGPGTGKTTAINGVLDVADSLKFSTIILSTTGKAANNVTLRTGRPASTIHRKLKINDNENTFKDNEEIYFNEDLIIIEEASMMDTQLFHAVVKALRKGSRLLLIGDTDQLPSVSYGNVLADLINSNLVTVTTLDKNFRQDEVCSIKENAHRIKENKPFLFENNVMACVRNTIEEIFERVRFYITAAIQSGKTFIVLSPNSNPKYALATPHLNKMIQAFVNPAKPNKNEMKAFGKLFREGDKVIQTKNNYELQIFNGDEGVITSINEEEVLVKFESNDSIVTLVKDDLEYLDLGYAISIHKSQGSEYDVVIIPVNEENFYALKQKQLFYTGLTRAKKFFLAIGNVELLHNHIFQQGTHRQTLLKQNLEIEFSDVPAITYPTNQTQVDLFGECEFSWV